MKGGSEGRWCRSRCRGGRPGPRGGHPEALGKVPPDVEGEPLLEMDGGVFWRSGGVGGSKGPTGIGKGTESRRQI